MLNQESVAREQNLNNLQSDAVKEQARYNNAIREIANLIQRQKKCSCIITVGFILRTHSLVFEFTRNGWTLRPDNYLHSSEVLKRYPQRSRRTRFYRMRFAQKRWLCHV